MKFLRKIRALFRKDELDAEMAEEMRAHVELQTERNLKAGLPADEARYAALRQFGNVAAIQEQAREARGWVWLEQTWQDIRYAFRQFAHSPGFTFVVVLTLALGIGSTTAIFSVVNTVILNPIGGTEPGRLILIGQRGASKGKESFLGLSLPAQEGLQARLDLFADTAWYFGGGIERKTDDFVRLTSGAYVSWNFFEILGTQPILGRGFRPEDAAEFADIRLAKDTPIILSHDWWQSEWGGDPNILGRVITQRYSPADGGGIDRHYTVVGVMPAHFQFPEQKTRFWLPFSRYVMPSSNGIVGVDWINLIGRLKPKTTPQQAQAALDVVAGQVMKAYPHYIPFWKRSNPRGLSLTFRPLSFALQNGGSWEQLHRTLYGLLAAIGFVLLIVCANVANLALARVERRQHELAVRSALGAGRGRLMRQLLTENLILALLGGMAGLIVTKWGLKALTALSGMPRLRPVEIDQPLLGVMLAVSALTGIAFGLVPMWRGGRVRVNAVLADGGSNATSGCNRSRYRNGLVIGQVAITMVLLTGAGLMLVSVNRLLRVDPGFDPENLLAITATFPLSDSRLPGESAEAWRAKVTRIRSTLLDQLHERFSALPGVKHAGFQMSAYDLPCAADGRTGTIMLGFVQVGTEEYDPLRAIGVPLIAGRRFRREDAAQKGLVLVNESMANAFWPGESAVGKKFHHAPDVPRGPIASLEVIGVVGDARLLSYATRPKPSCYYPYDPSNGFGQLRFFIRTAGDPERQIAAVRHEMQAMDSSIRNPVFGVVRQSLIDSTLAQRAYRNYLGLFAGVGLLLSSLGIYGVLSYSVARRTREIGIRIAIGAEDRQIRTMIVAQGVWLIATGLIVGLFASWGLTRFLRNQLFDVSPTDPLVIGAVVILLSVVAVLACWLPARRAAKVDPMVALRAE